MRCQQRTEAHMIGGAVGAVASEERKDGSEAVDLYRTPYSVV